MTDHVAEIMRLVRAYADAWHRDESTINPRSFKSPEKEETLQSRIRKLVEEWDNEIARSRTLVNAAITATERAERAEAEAAALRNDLIEIVDRGIINAPCPSPLQWKQMQEKFRPMIAALAEKDDSRAAQDQEDTWAAHSHTEKR